MIYRDYSDPRRGSWFMCLEHGIGNHLVCAYSINGGVDWKCRDERTGERALVYGKSVAEAWLKERMNE